MGRIDEMNKFVAFLRGINVGGHKPVRMDDLANVFVSIGLKNVTTYIQSGNVIFETTRTNRDALTKKIEEALDRLLGYQVKVFLRTADELETLVRLDPFKNVKTGADAKPYVTFLAEAPGREVKVPLMSLQGDVEIIRISGCDVLSLSRRIKGRSGYPNNFIEKEFGLPATTRNWATVTKVVK